MPWENKQSHIRSCQCDHLARDHLGSFSVCTWGTCIEAWWKQRQVTGGGWWEGSASINWRSANGLAINLDNAAIKFKSKTACKQTKRSYSRFRSAKIDDLQLTLPSVIGSYRSSTPLRYVKNRNRNFSLPSWIFIEKAQTNIKVKK